MAEKARGIPRLTLHAPFCELTPCAVDPYVAEVSRRRYEQAAELALSHGVTRMVVHGGFIPNVYDPRWYVERSPRFWRDFLADKPADFGLLIENVLDDAPELPRDVLAGVDDPRAGACLDIGHAHVASKTPVLRWIEVLTPWLRHAHLHDNDGAFDRHAPLGAGTIPCEAVLRALPEKCTLTLENMEAERSLRWLKDKGWM